MFAPPLVQRRITGTPAGRFTLNVRGVGLVRVGLSSPASRLHPVGYGLGYGGENWGFGSIAVYPPDHADQRAAGPPPSLVVQANDHPLEREADRIAQQVTGAGAPQAGTAVTAGTLGLARACAACAEEEANLQREPAVQVQAAGGMRAPASVAATLRAPGRAIPPGERGFLERRFGRSFADVRMHDDAAAAVSARAVGANAYTVGNHVVFAAGRYDPASLSGQRLLAHELVHVMQQAGAAGPSTLQRQADDSDAESAALALADTADPDLDLEEADGDASNLTPPGQADEIAAPLEAAAGKKAPKKATRSNLCDAGDCPQGKQAKANHDDCAKGSAGDKDRYITKLDVDVDGGKMVATWSNGGTDNWRCSANPRVTPRGDDVIGIKCGINHTNKKKDGMAWFTGLAKEGYRIGFHDSQPVGPGYVSHGCIRVCCGVAKTIHDNTSSGVTKVSVT